MAQLLTEGEKDPVAEWVDDALRSGRIDLLQDEDLKKILLQWGTDLDLIQTYMAIQTDWQNEQILPFMNRFISLRQTERYGGNSWYKPSKLPFRYEPLFQSLEFENILDNNIFLLNDLIQRLHDIRQSQEEVLARTGQSAE